MKNIKILKRYINAMKNHDDIALYNIDDRDLAKAIENVLNELDKYKRLAEANLKDSEEFKDNMCNHRCILNNEVKELQEDLDKKYKIISKAIEEIEYIRQYFSEDCQADFIRILEILKDKDVIDW